MDKYYCKCLNVGVELDSNASPPDEPLNLSDEEKKDQFFAELPLLIVRQIKVKNQQPILVRSRRIGSWDVYRCINCSTYSHAIENESSNTMLMNKSLQKLTDTEVQNIKNSIDFSPAFNIVVSDTSLFNGNVWETSQLNGKSSNDFIELQKQLSQYEEQKSKITEENIRIYVEQQQSALKKLRKRANEDFHILTDIIMKTENEPGSKNEPTPKNGFSESKTLAPVKISTNSVIYDFDDLNLSPQTSKQTDKCEAALGIPPSFDSEGLFPFDGMEERNILDEDEHSEDDLSDTDDSGSRDEGIHIPRRRSFAIAKSLPIRVPGDYDPSFRFTDSKRDTKKPNYKQKRNERPLDIAASIKALANSVHGDTIFGDLPPPRIGSKI